LDEVTFREISVMWIDGMIGNGGIIETLGNLTAGVYNYMRAANTPPYKVKDIIKPQYDYLHPTQNKTSASDTLLSILTTAPGFSINKVG
jgi:hypothetical protein